MYSRAILSNMLWVPIEEVHDKVRRSLTFKPHYENLGSIPVYREVNGLFGFPRNYRLNVAKITKEVSDGHEALIDFRGTLRPEQIPVVDEFAENWRNKIDDQIIVADTGAGKTIMALAILCELGRTTLVIVPKTDLLKQWKDKILEFTTCKEHEIGLARQSICDFEGKKIVIGMIHSLSKDKYPKEFVNYFGVVVTDEIHKLGASTFSNTACLYPARHRLGVTATLQRADGMDAIVHAHLGYTIIKPKKSVQPNPTIAFSFYRKSSGRIPHWATKPMQRRGKLISLLATNRHRTAKIVEAVIRIVKSGRQTMVVSERIDHLKEISDVLITNGAGLTFGFYLGKTSQKEKERVSKECDIILATTPMLSLGTDIPTLKALIFATPLSNVMQTIGRTRRILKGAKTPFVYDIIDTEYEETVRWARNRRKFYKSKNYKIVNVTE